MTTAPVLEQDPMEGSDRAASGSGRVLVVAPEPFYEDRGTPICVRQVVVALRQLGHPVDVLTYPLGQDIPEEGVRILRASNPFGVRSVPIGFSWRKVMLDLSLAGRLRRALRETAYVAVHAVEESAFLAVHFGRRHGLPVIYDMHSSMAEQLGARREFRLLSPLLDGAERWLLRRADAVACSAGLLSRVRRQAPGALAREWRFAPAAPLTGHGDRSALRSELALEPHQRVVLYSGTFEAYQGIDLLLDAAASVLRARENAVLVLVGVTRAESATAKRRIAESLPPGRVRLIERQPRESLAHYLHLADVVVSPRVYGGNLPLKIFDYLAAGRPIVATDLPTHRTMLSAERALLVAPTAPALADGILRLLDDAGLAARLGDGARRWAEAELGWPAFVRDVDSLYRDAGVRREAASAR